MQNDRQRCKIKVRKFLFNILWRFGVIEESPRGGGFHPPVLIGLMHNHALLHCLLSRNFPKFRIRFHKHFSWTWHCNNSARMHRIIIVLRPFLSIFNALSDCVSWFLFYLSHMNSHEAYILEATRTGHVQHEFMIADVCSWYLVQWQLFQQKSNVSNSQSLAPWLFPDDEKSFFVYK